MVEDIRQDPILKRALKRYESFSEEEFDNRAAMLEDLEFAYNVGRGQWNATVRADRAAAGRPCLTSNKLRIHVANVANKERDNRISGTLRPVDSEGDPVTARNLAGMVRHTEHISKAQRAYTQAGEHAVAGGAGYCRIITEEIAGSFDQKAYIQGIDDPLSVRLDRNKEWATVRECISRDEFKERYPKANADFGLDASYDGADVDYTGWCDEEHIYIADYYYKEFEDITIAEAVHPVTGKVWTVELSEELTIEAIEAEGFVVQRTADQRKHVVKIVKISAVELLDDVYDWPGNEIPVFKVTGDTITIAGKRYDRSLIRDAKDPQSMYNISLTHNTEVVMLQPKAPFKATPEQMAGHEEVWARANTDNLPVLPYNDTGSPMPAREAPPMPSPGATQLAQFSAGDIKDATGLREASFGETSNERTGVAIQQRAVRSDFNTFHFPDNYKRFIVDITRELVVILPKIVDTERVERIIGEEGEEELIVVNHQVPDLMNPGETITFNDISVGTYDVIEDTKAWSTKRQEQEQGMKDAMNGAPNIAPLIVPDLARLQDWPNAEKFAEKVEAFTAQLLGAPAQAGNVPTGGQ